VRRKFSHHQKKPKRYTSTLFLIALITGIPVFGTLAIQVLTLRPDLRDARLEKVERPGDALLLDWQSLEQSSSSAAKLSETAQHAQGKRGRVLGYMMDFVRPIRGGERIRELVIAPECGTFLHPAHFDPDQAIGVYLQEDCAAVFERKKAVWVTGTFSVQRSKSDPERPLYRLDDACLEKISDEELRRLMAR
jgi:hypothetical protein